MTGFLLILKHKDLFIIRYAFKEAKRESIVLILSKLMDNFAFIFHITQIKQNKMRDLFDLLVNIKESFENIFLTENL